MVTPTPTTNMTKYLFTNTGIHKKPSFDNMVQSIFYNRASAIDILVFLGDTDGPNITKHCTNQVGILWTV